MLELNQIYNEDCLGERGMCLIPDKSVDMILCDLPYAATQNEWDSLLPLDKLWNEYKRIIKPSGAIVLTAQQPFSSLLVMSNIKWFRYEWIWEKNMVTGHLNAHRMPMRKHESVLIFYEKESTYNPQNLIPYNQIKRRGNNGKNYGYSNPENFQEFTNYPVTIQKFDSDTTNLHPTQKPVALFEYLIRTYTDAGGVVLDNCMGSGTTAVACIATRRNFIGFERDPEYHKIATERIANVQSALFV